MSDQREFLTYEEGEEHIVRRLGAAVVSLWDTFPEESRERIVRTALHVRDKYDTVSLNEQIRMFIREHAGQR